LRSRRGRGKGEGVWGEGEGAGEREGKRAVDEEEDKDRRDEAECNARGEKFGWDWSDLWGGAEWRKKPGTPWLLTEAGQITMALVVLVLMALTLAEQMHIKNGGLPWIDLSKDKDWAERRDAAAFAKAAKAAQA